MAHPNVVHCKRARYDVYIGRPSKWGNPFQIGRDGTRAEVIARYERWVGEQPELTARSARLRKGMDAKLEAAGRKPIKPLPGLPSETDG